ncbi:hypothetical protein BHE74_00020753 [Ensete ventricosum]|nr:hypothetical protein GW17_00060131 [Ensete ventricosum]RWW71509.1 hypothetical protein BHE74_00020753 [Ensete ventricosum]
MLHDSDELTSDASSKTGQVATRVYGAGTCDNQCLGSFLRHVKRFGKTPFGVGGGVGGRGMEGRGGENDRVNNGPTQLTQAHARPTATSTPRVETQLRQFGGHVGIQGGIIRTTRHPV